MRVCVLERERERRKAQERVCCALANKTNGVTNSLHPRVHVVLQQPYAATSTASKVGLNMWMEQKISRVDFVIALARVSFGFPFVGILRALPF